MWTPDAALKVWLYRRATDMRKSYDGLIALVKQQLHDDPLNGSLYVFVNRRRTQMKCLYFEGDGYCLWSKRLEQGQFRVSFNGIDKARVELSTLKLLIDGIDVESLRRFKRYKHSPLMDNRVQ
jgi:transposase